MGFTRGSVYKEWGNLWLQVSNEHTLNPKPHDPEPFLTLYA